MRKSTATLTPVQWLPWVRALVLVTSLLTAATFSWAGGIIGTFTDEALRSAVAGGGYVMFAGSGTVELTSPLIITTNTTITGTGYSVVLSGRGSNAILQVNAELTLLGVTLTNGWATNGGGVFIKPTGVMVASNCVFAGNTAAGTNGVAGTDGADSSSVGKNGAAGGSGTSGQGGAIFNQGQLKLLACQFLTNSATGGSGAAGGAGGDGDFEGGDGGRGGNGGAALGGAVCSSGTLAASNCTFTGNFVVGGSATNGGAAGNGPFPGHRGHGGAGGAGNGAALYCLSNCVVVNCTFLGNKGTGGNSGLSGQESNGNGKTAAAGGDALGGAAWCGGVSGITNSTFSANAVVGGNGGEGGDAGSTGLQGGDGGRGGYGMGGSICGAGTVRLVNCTLVGGNSMGGLGGLGGDGPFPGDAGNDAPARGGNIANNGGTLLLKNTILAYPASGTNSYAVTNVVSTVTNYSTEVTVVSTNTFGLVNGSCDLGLSLGCYTNIVFTNGSTLTTNVFFLTNCILTQLPEVCLTNLVLTNVVVSNYSVTIWVTNVVGVTNIGVGFNAYGNITDAGQNLSSDASPTFGSASWNRVDPELGDLAANGGFTKTFALLAGSPALNAADDAAALPFDQRGAIRPSGGRCDIGAVEMGGPVIQTQPQSQIVTSGASVQFFVAATGEITPSYQWRFNGAALANATATQFILASAQPADAGNYTVLVANPYGAVTSQVATLTVFPPLQPGLVDATNLALSYATRSGHRYFIEYKTVLTDTNWTRLSTNSGNGGVLTSLVPITELPSRFFRLVEE